MYMTLTSLGLSGSRLAGVIGEELHNEIHFGLLELVHDGVVEGILVLLQPATQVVSHSAGVVDDGEVTFSLSSLWRLRLDEAGRLAQMVGLQLLLKRLVSSLREHGLLLEDGEEAKFLCEES